MKLIAISVFRFGNSKVEFLVSDDGAFIHVRRSIPHADIDVSLRVFDGRDMLQARQFYMGWVNDAVTRRFDVVRFIVRPPDWAISEKGRDNG